MRFWKAAQDGQIKSNREQLQKKNTQNDPPTPILHEKHATGLIRPSAGRVQYPFKKVLPENKTSKIVQNSKYQKRATLKV